VVVGYQGHLRLADIYLCEGLKPLLLVPSRNQGRDRFVGNDRTSQGVNHINRLSGGWHRSSQASEGEKKSSSLDDLHGANAYGVDG